MIRYHYEHIRYRMIQRLSRLPGLSGLFMPAQIRLQRYHLELYRRQWLGDVR